MGHVRGVEPRAGRSLPLERGCGQWVRAHSASAASEELRGLKIGTSGIVFMAVGPRVIKMGVCRNG